MQTGRGGQLKRLYKYAGRFGLVTGVGNALQVAKSRGLVRVRPGRNRPPIRLRSRSSDIDVFEEVCVRRAYTTDRLEQYRPRVIVDAGANIGITSVYFANLYPYARIISIEPEHSNYELLCKNTEAYPQITPLRAALWKRDSNLLVENPGGGFWSFRVRDALAVQESTCSVAGITVDSICHRFGFDVIDLLKIDIEGAEDELFSGDVSWLGRTRQLIIELHDRFKPDCSRNFYSALINYSFTQEIKDKNIFIELNGRAVGAQTMAVSAPVGMRLTTR